MHVEDGIERCDRNFRHVSHALGLPIGTADEILVV